MLRRILNSSLSREFFVTPTVASVSASSSQPLLFLMISRHLCYHGNRQVVSLSRYTSENGFMSRYTRYTVITTRGKKDSLQSKLVNFEEDEIERQFVRGSGPGGQATNKTSNCVILKHLPTGIVVKCHQTRSQTKNEEIARRILREKLDIHFKGEDSVIIQEKKKEEKKKQEKKRKSKIKLEKLRAFRASLQTDDN
ncbi:mitochondrial translation release factor in rescue-like [Ptychodera flava]|uniref:mitochondrial translation release factor in rescue-like n=1 Tax=Ptychodera flava TaxID=63121 RepID=UPI003969D9E2